MEKERDSTPAVEQAVREFDEERAVYRAVFWGKRERALVRCAACGGETRELADGVCLLCWSHTCQRCGKSVEHTCACPGVIQPMPLSRHKRMVEEQEASIRLAVEVGLVEETEQLIF